MFNKVTNIVLSLIISLSHYCVIIVIRVVCEKDILLIEVFHGVLQLLLYVKLLI